MGSRPRLPSNSPNGSSRKSVHPIMRTFFDCEFIEDGRTIELLSIGAIRDDGLTYYAEIAETDRTRADDWVKENVLPHLTGPVLPRAEIASSLLAFAGNSPEWWAYYADYDWVALCQLYGRMIDLPAGWPMYCRDLKQLADECGNPDLKVIPMFGAEHNALSDAWWVRDAYQYLTVAPGQPGVSR